MSRFTISARERRTIRLALLVLAPALGYVYFVKPYAASRSAMQDRILVERDALMRERALLAQAGRTSSREHAGEAVANRTAQLLFDGRDDVIASSGLAAYVTSIAMDARVNLQQAATRPAILSSGGVRMLRVEVRGESDLQGILAFLNALETGDKLIRIDKLDISRTPGRSVIDDEFETLSLAATISAFALSDTAREVPAAPPAAPSARSAARRGSP